MNFYTYVRCIGNTLYYRGIRDSQRVKERVDYSPMLFLPTTKSHTDFHTLDGIPVEPKFFDDIKTAKGFLKSYKDVDGFTIYGQTRFEYAYIADEFPEKVIEWSPEQVCVAYIDIEVFSEAGFPKPEDAAQPVTAITVKLSTSPIYHVWGTGVYLPHLDVVRYHQCTTEIELLQDFLQFWNEQEPDIVTGWNVKSFDIPYLYHRLINLCGEQVARRLSPFGKLLQNEEQFYGKTIISYDILGIATLDYLQLFRKYAPNASQESYKLEHIANVELKESKLSYEEYETLHQLYTLNYQKFIEYNVKDVSLVEQLNAKGRLIEMALTLAYDNKTNYEDVYSQVRMWDVICYNHLRTKNIVLPPITSRHKDEAYEGAYVKDPQVGLFEWVVSFDLASLYPHLIMQYNLSPETIINPTNYTPAMTQMIPLLDVNSLLEETVDTQGLNGATVTPNRQFFSTQKQGFLPEIMESMFQDRNVYKQKMLVAKKQLEILKKDPIAPLITIKNLQYDISKYNNLQLAKKCGLNSAYGAMGNQYFRFFDTRIAEAITLSGQLSIRWIEKDLNKYMNTLFKTTAVDYIIAIDTDSVYLNLSALVKKGFTDKTPKDKIVSALDKFCIDKLQQYIDASYNRLAQYVHAYAQKMQMKREAIADKAIWTAKKRYLLNVYDLEGVRFINPQLKIQGLEAVKSSTPSACRDKIKDVLKLIFSGTESEVQVFINKFKQEFATLEARDIAFPRTVNGVLKYDLGQTNAGNTMLNNNNDYMKMKGTPIHVRGSLVYNHTLGIDNLLNQYQTIQEGEKIKFVHLKEPNRFHSSVISFIQQPPKQWHLESLIDYDTQFQKSFVEPIKVVLNSIGWHTEQVANLESFFS